MNHFVFLSFDLGVQGDYEGLYGWLDQHKAKECGDSVACFRYEHSGSLIEDLKRDLREAVSLNKKSRIYVIREEGGKMRGTFLFGRRRDAPWTGYAPAEEQEEDSEDSYA